MEKPFYKSKKLWTALIAGAAAAVKTLGVDVPDELFYVALAYLGAQGVADIGKNKPSLQPAPLSEIPLCRHQAAETEPGIEIPAPTITQPENQPLPDFPTIITQLRAVAMVETGVDDAACLWGYFEGVMVRTRVSSIAEAEAWNEQLAMITRDAFIQFFPGFTVPDNFDGVDEFRQHWKDQVGNPKCRLMNIGERLTLIRLEWVNQHRETLQQMRAEGVRVSLMYPQQRTAWSVAEAGRYYLKSQAMTE